MPELPEVQTIVDDLQKKVVGRRIIGVWCDTPKLIKSPEAEEFEKQIKGSKIESVSRHGKNILIYLSGGNLLLIHQKLTGHLLVGKWKITKVSGVRCQVSSLIEGPLTEPVNDFIHLIFYLDNGEELALSDLRKFAKVILGPREEIEKLPDLAKIGPDPLEKNFNFEKFADLIGARKQKIKQVLMNQEIIAGIGNIYSDEILWSAKIHPFRLASKLIKEELKRIYEATREILAEAVKLRGTSTSDYRDTSGERGKYAEVIRAYRREGGPCLRCGTPIKRVKMGGRSAHFCPECQI